MEKNHPWHFSSEPNPPLKCDKDGNLRILVVGNSGAGKSTMAHRLAELLQLPVVHLDTLHYQPSWREIPDEEFCGTVQSFISEHDSWIIDGNYSRLLGNLTNATATCILWMDPPFLLYFPRLIIRTFLRLVRLTPPCSPGCNESLSDIFSFGEKSILWWSWTNHTPVRNAYIAEMQQPGNDKGGKWIRLAGWGGEVKAWLKHVESFVKVQ